MRKHHARSDFTKAQKEAAQTLRTQVAGAILGAKLPQTRDGFVKHPIG